jgi:hypothetical protein
MNPDRALRVLKHPKRRAKAEGDAPYGCGWYRSTSPSPGIVELRGGKIAKESPVIPIHICDAIGDQKVNRVCSHNI